MPISTRPKSLSSSERSFPNSNCPGLDGIFSLLSPDWLGTFKYFRKFSTNFSLIIFSFIFTLPFLLKKTQPSCDFFSILIINLFLGFGPFCHNLYSKVYHYEPYNHKILGLFLLPHL